MKHLSTSKILVFSFASVIFIGALLLSLPIASADGSVTSFLDAFFTATTATCVTGLTTVTTAGHWSTFGHVIILILIQIGGMGAATLPMFIFVILGRRLSLRYNKILGDSFNLDSIGEVHYFFRRIIGGIFVVETIGAMAYLPVFVPEYGVRRGVWYSFFHSISAFCNAGIDIIGSDSLMPYVDHVWMNLVTMSLIILGGIGFIVWWDVLHYLFHRGKLSLHSKIILRMTMILIIVGAITFLVFEYQNPNTIGNLPFGSKLLASLFQSVTTRTAGFASISQAGLSLHSIIISVLLMFIGGSSVGTAGGVKTGTIAVILLSVASTIRGKDDIRIFNRRIPHHTVRKAMAIVALSLIFSVIALFTLLMTEQAPARDILFEVFSALGTAGLSRNLTPSLSGIGKLVIIVCMFFGRIGPISIASALTIRETNETFRYIEEDITVG